MATPHAENVEHRSFLRLRNSRRFLKWLNVQGTRLGTSSTSVFALLLAGNPPVGIEAIAPTVAPANTAVPTVTGTARVGQTLTATPGTWTGNPAPTFSYQWQRGTTNISGATSATYVAVTADVGQTLRCVVTATNSKGSASANSANTASVGQTPANTVAPTISGTPTVGQTLTANNGTWTGTPAPTFGRQWKRNATNISGATGATYVLAEADVGATITVTVTGTNSAGNASATSAGVGPVSAE